MENQKAITYDYKTIRVKREMEAMTTDAYQNLGWEVTGQFIEQGTLNNINVSLKRDRHINNKPELNALQSKIDLALANIEKMQAKKKVAGLAEALTVGTIGALTFGGGMSMVMVFEGLAYMIGGIALGIAGISIGLLGWLTFNLVKKKKLKKLDPAFENEFDKFSDLCEEANKLL